MRRSLPSVRSALGWAALLLMCAWAAAAVPFLDKCVQHRTYPFSLHQNHSIYADVNTSPMSTSTLHVEGAVTLISHNVEKDFCVYRMTVAFTSRVNVSGSESSTLPSTASDEEHLRHFMASWADVQSMTRVQPVIFKQALSGEISDVHIPYPGDSQNTAGIKMAVEALLDQLSFSASHIGEAARVTTKEVDNFDEDTGSSTPLVLSMSDKYSVDLSKSGVRAYRFERDVFPAHGPTGPQSAPHMVNRREITETFVRPGHPGFALSLHKTVVASVRSGDIINAEDLEWASGSEGPFGGSFGFRMESVTILGSASDFAAEVAEFVNEPIVFEPREIDVSALSPSGSDPAKSNDEFSPFDETDETLTTGRDAVEDEEEEEGLYDAVQTEADRRETGGLDIFSDQEEKPSDVQYPSLLSVRERSGDLTEKQRRRLARANMRLRSSRTYATASESSSFGFNPKAEQSEESSRATWEHSSVGSESSFSSSSARSSSSSGEIGVEKVNYKTVFEKRVWFGGVKDMLGYFDGGIRAAAWELNDQKVIDLGIVFDIGAMFWGQQFSVIRAIPGSRLFMNTRKAKWTLNIEEPHRPEALRMVRSLFGFSFPVEEDPRKPQDKFPECGPKPGPYLKRTLDEYYYARKVPKKVENRFGCISGIRLSLYVWGVGTQVKVKMNLEPKFRMASDVCEQDDFNADTPPRFAAIGGQIDGQVTAQIFICAVNAAHGMQVLSPSKCNFPLRGPTVGRGSLTLIDFSWKIAYNAAVDDLLSGCISSVADVKHFGGKIALTREALEGRKWENALFSQDLQPSCPKALQSLRRTWCIKGKQTKMVGNGTVDATGPPGIDETARQLGLLVRCSPADEYSSRLPGMRPLWFKRHTATGKWQWTPFEPGMRKRLRKWMFVNETSVSPTAKKWPNKPLLAQNVQLVKILNGTYNETEPLATQLGMVRCTLADYCFHPRLDSTIWLRKVNSSWFWTPLDPTFIRRNKYWLPVSTTLIPETYPMWKSTTPTDAVLRVLKSLQTGRLMALASSLSSSSASSSAESSEFSESSSGSSRSSSSRSSSSQSLSSASAIPAAVKPTPGTGVIETNPKDRIARALRLTFMNGEFVDRKCLEDVLCDPIWFRKEHNQWWWTPYPPTHKRRQWFSTNIVRVPDDAPKPWTGRIPPDNDVKMIRVFARAAILGNADAKPAPIKQKAKRNKKKRL